MKKKILLLEDDPNLGFVLQEQLEANGFVVTLKANGEEGMSAAAKASHDLYLVDVMMPRKDGFTFAREIRQRNISTPIIFLTAKSLKEDRIEGFKVGGDDYVTKPFSTEELLLRIRAVLRRSGFRDDERAAKTFTLGKMRFDSKHQILERGGRTRRLTAKESLVLQVLCLNENTTVPRTDLLLSVWGDDSYSNGRSLDVFISKLRKYLAADSSVEIKNEHGKGYKLLVP
ncbi:MAG: response regulator transcription factor [Bacteroidota bacterium]